MAMECWVSGNLEWSFGTHRYFGFDNEKIRETLVVELSPSKAFIAHDSAYNWRSSDDKPILTLTYSE